MNQLMNFHEPIIYGLSCMCDTERKRENLILDMEAVAEEIGNLKDRVRKLLPIAGELAYKDEHSIRKFVEIAKSIDSDPETNAAHQVAARLLETLLTKNFRIYLLALQQTQSLAPCATSCSAAGLKSIRASVVHKPAGFPNSPPPPSLFLPAEISLFIGKQPAILA